MDPRFTPALALAFGLVCGASTCNPPPPPAGATTQPVASRPECPGEDTLAITVLDSVTKVRGKQWYFYRTVRTIPLAGVNSNVPEFHDCQRFIVKDEKDTTYHYDSLYALFASSSLRVLVDSLDTLPYSATKRAWPSAVVLSYGGTYGTLGILPDFNCLYLYRDLSTWKARMVPIGSHEDRCLGPLADPKGTAGTDLEVRPVLTGHFGDNDIPDAARWDWDSVNLKQYIGIKCGLAWCEVGEGGFVSSRLPDRPPRFESVPGPAPTIFEGTRVFRVKGWYDWQRLAVWNDAHKLVPGGVWGTIIPHPTLGRPDHDVASYFHPWVNVASAIVTGDYVTKSVSFQRGENRIWLCSGTKSDCDVPDATTACPSPTGILWWAKMEPMPVGKPTYRCVVMRSHPGAKIPATSRWRWSETDETNWIRCTGGCCEIK